MQTDTRHLRELKLTYVARHDVDGQPLALDTAITDPAQAAEILRAILQHEPVEVFGVLLLSTKHDVLAYHEVSRGTLDSSLVHPREVFKAAILANASAIILAHNHPSGNPAPSADDHEVTRRLARAGRPLGVHVLDHVIVGEPGYVSFRARGLLDAPQRRGPNGKNRLASWRGTRDLRINLNANETRQG